MLLRSNPVNILRYLPEFLAKDEKFRQTGNVCSTEHERIRLLLIDMLNQFFIKTATWGLAYWERVLEITPAKSDGYEVRRNRILLRLQSSQTSTITFMKELVERYAVSGANCAIVEHNDENWFQITTNGGGIEDLNGMFEAVEIYKPAHLGVKLTYERPIISNLFFGQFIRSGKRTTINAVNKFNLNIVEGLSGYGFAIKTARHVIIKAVV